MALIQLRRGTAANWTSANPTLASGEPGVETDTGKLKIGNGTTAWNALAYVVGSGGSGGVTSVNLRTGAVTLTASDVGLANVNNTSDAAKPVSTAQQAALDLKANLASPTFTGTVGGITKAMVGLGNVDNTSDVNKPVSTATQNALNLKVSLSGDETIGGTKTFLLSPSVPTSPVDDNDVPSKIYVDSSIDTAVPAGSYSVFYATGDDSNLSAALASAPTNAFFVAVKVAGS